MAAARKKTVPVPKSELRGEAAWAAAQKGVAERNAAAYANDRAVRDVSEAKAQRRRREQALLEDADLPTQPRRD